MIPRGAWLVATLLGASACGTRPQPGPAWLVVGAPPGEGVDLPAAEVDGAALRATFSGVRLIVEVAPGEGEVVVRAPGACPLRVPGGELRAGETTSRTLAPWLTVEGPHAPVGYGARLVVSARSSCPEASVGRVELRQQGGRALRDVVRRDGAFEGTFPPLADALGAELPWGVVPVSADARAEVEVEARWSGPGLPDVVRVERYSAAARSRGLPTVAVGTRLYLGGEGFRIRSAPAGSRAALAASDGATSFEPDAAGTFLLEDGRGRSLRLVAGTYADTPLDCGRAGCHEERASAARGSPMATILQRGLDGPFGPAYPSCALACHATGEPGEDDRGFAAVARELGLGDAELVASGWHELPASLRRLGGVTCLACHGPSAIPEPSARHASLRADVCATCHDAPPRYGHVAAWRSSRMSRSDADPRTRGEPACARCHTTWGFLGHADHAPPPEAPPAGIACAACHDVHPAGPRDDAIGRTCAEALRREVPLPPILDGAVPESASRSRVCLPCHAPTPGAAAPDASAAALWAGRGGLEPATGAPLEGAAPHRALAGGCLACHTGGPDGLARGAAHAFRANAEGCGACHAARRDPRLHARAVALWARVVGAAGTAGPPGPPHAGARRGPPATPLERAAWDVALVLEDPAADAHGGAYATALLDAAERVLGPAAPAATTNGALPP